MTDAQPPEPVKIPHFGGFENALADLFLRHTLARIRGHDVEHLFDRGLLETKLTAWISGVILSLHANLNRHVAKYKLVTATELVTSYLLPQFSTSEHDSKISPVNPTCLTDEVVNDLLRPLVFRITFRLIRPTTHHAYKMVTVNGILEECHDESVPGSSVMNGATHPIPFIGHAVDIPGAADFDQLRPRQDLTPGWCRHYTLVDDLFERGQTRVLTNEDLVYNLTRQDIIGDMTRTLFGLEGVSIDEIDLEGQITIRTQEAGIQVAIGT